MPVEQSHFSFPGVFSLTPHALKYPKYSFKWWTKTEMPKYQYL